MSKIMSVLMRLYQSEPVATGYVLQAAVTGALALATTKGWISAEMATPLAAIALTALEALKRQAVYSRKTVAEVVTGVGNSPSSAPAVVATALNQ